ncbi:hypothetical protein [Pseudarthrobacter sp. S9]|uniref:hypothetical protein n=1 Tax=Pseudarthrobacter sp. S9 TaxID=3418421 RepID=UPI003D08EDEC
MDVKTLLRLLRTSRTEAALLVARFPGVVFVGVLEGIVMIARFDAPLFFANGAVFTEHIRTRVANAPRPVRWVIVASEAITDVETTALDDLVELDDELARCRLA